MAQQHPVKATDVQRFGNQTRDNIDLLAVEEPLEIRLEFGPHEDRQQRNIAVTMRTPGHDLELAAGFLFSEGILDSLDEILKIDWCPNVQSPEDYGNVVKIELLPTSKPDLSKLDRNFYMTSSCGVCGKASLEAIYQAGCSVLPMEGSRFSGDFIRSLPAKADAVQTVFQHTGGIHAASVFDASGELLVIREDVGRHNAVDKAIGDMFLKGKIPLHDHVLLVSGRAGFELVQKAVKAGVSLMVAIGAPTSLAVDLAQQHKMSLVGFLRGDKFNVYAGNARILS